MSETCTDFRYNVGDLVFVRPFDEIIPNGIMSSSSHSYFGLDKEEIDAASEYSAIFPLEIQEMRIHMGVPIYKISDASDYGYWYTDEMLMLAIEDEEFEPDLSDVNFEDFI